MDCSVIVCTHNRAKSLANTIYALLCQEYPLEKFEILVVDNGSIDDTKEVVESIKQKANVPLHYIFEERIGLSYARNTGVDKARGQVVCFTDDDALPGKHWLKNILLAFEDDSVAVAGGDVYPVWPGAQKPEWLHKYLYKYLGIVDFYFSEMTELSYPEYPYGVNIAFRRRVVVDLGGFSIDLGRSGDFLLSGEEIELCQRIHKGGYKIVYMPDAVVDHVIAEERINKEWFLQRAFSQGTSKADIEFGVGCNTNLVRLFFKRACICVASGLAWVICSVLLQKKIAFVSQCKFRMSFAYLIHLVAVKKNISNGVTE